MNIRKRLAVAAAIVLPATGLAVIGGTQIASAGGPPVLTCSSLGSDANSYGGVSFDNGAGPGTAGLDLGASISATAVTTVDPIQLVAGGNVVQLEAEAIAGQTLNLANGQVVTVVSDTLAKTGVASSKDIETAIITPNLGATIAKKASVTINPSGNGVYATGDGTVSTTSNVVTGSTGEFSAYDNQTVEVSYLDTSPNPDGSTTAPLPPYDSYWSPFDPPATARNDNATVTISSATVSDASITSADDGEPVYGVTTASAAFVNGAASGSFQLSSSPSSLVSDPAEAPASHIGIGLPSVTPVQVSEFISNVNLSGSQATISENETPASVGSGTTAHPQSTTESVDSTFSGPVVVTMGSTNQVTGSVETDYDLALTNCQSSLHADAGVIYPNNVTLTTPTGTGTSGPSSVLALESGVSPVNGLSVNYPSGLPAGYSWGGALSPDTTSVSFDSSKDVLNLADDAETFVDGVVPSSDAYPTSKAAMTFGLGGAVICTEGQLQAIGTGNGSHSGIDAGSIPAATNTGSATTTDSVAAEALAYCDGGTSSALTRADTFGELANVEINPNGGGAGSDGTGLAAIWVAAGTGTATL